MYNITSLAVILILALSIPATAAASTAFGTCQAATPPALPATIASQAEADALLAQVNAYMEAARGYRTCLVDYANDNLDTLSEADKSALRTAFDASTARTKTFATNWNNIYGAFLAQ